MSLNWVVPRNFPPQEIGAGFIFIQDKEEWWRRKGCVADDYSSWSIYSMRVWSFGKIAGIYSGKLVNFEVQ
jgi:hypothetical protein